MALEMQDNPSPYLTLVETADPSTPAAGTKRVWLDTDGILKEIDESGTVTAVGGAAGSVATDAIWDAAGDLVVGTGANTAAKLTAGATAGHVLTSNGSGAAPSWQAVASAPNLIPIVEAYAATGASTASLAVTIAAAAAGKRLIVTVSSNARDVNTPTCTNVTFTEVAATNFSTTIYVSVYVGVVAGGSSGTTVTITATGTNTIVADVFTVADTLTPTAGTTATLSNTDVTTQYNIRTMQLASTRGTFWVFVGAEDNGTTSLRFGVSAPHMPGQIVNSHISAIGYAPGGTFVVNLTAGHAAADFAGVLVAVT